VVLLHSCQTEQFASTAIFKKQQQIIRGVKGKVQSHNKLIGVFLQYAVLGEHAFDLQIKT
jgi:hypothetical protein